ncbi:MAG: nitroreductase family protein [Beijerinckiaceae bacterium]
MGLAAFHPLDFRRKSEAEMLAAAETFRAEMTRRRTVRDYAPDPVPRAIIEHAIMTAGTAPSGANQQPWSFAAISSPDIKKRIREAAEEEEKQFYAGRAGGDWLDALSHLGTDWEKPFLEEAPWLIAIFAQRWGEADGKKVKHYYVPESVGIATGFLIAALHQAGLATLTHTPSPMGFLNEICGRPESEKAVILLIVGYPKEGCQVPKISKKTLDEMTVWL